MDNFLDSYHLPKLNQVEISNLSRLIHAHEIVIKSLPTKNPEQDGLAPHSTKMSKKSQCQECAAKREI